MFFRYQVTRLPRPVEKYNPSGIGKVPKRERGRGAESPWRRSVGETRQTRTLFYLCLLMDSSISERLRSLRRYRVEPIDLPRGRIVPGSQKRRHDPEDDLFLLPRPETIFFHYCLHTGRVHLFFIFRMDIIFHQKVVIDGLH